MRHAWRLLSAVLISQCTWGLTGGELRLFCVAIAALTMLAACGRQSDDQQQRSNDRRGAVDFASISTPPPPPPTRACTQLEASLIASKMAQNVYDKDGCVWMKSGASGQVSMCEFENASRLIRASGSVTIRDNLTSDAFQVAVAGIFSAEGEPLRFEKTSVSYSYQQACTRAGAMITVMAAGCAMDANCRSGNRN